MEKPLAGGGCVERSKAICDVRAVRCRLEPRRLTFPFAQFRRTDYALPRELCQASHSREESARNDSLVLSLPLLSLSLPLPSMLNPPPPRPPSPCLKHTFHSTIGLTGMHARAAAHTRMRTHAHTKNQMPLVLLCRHLKRGRQPSDVELGARRAELWAGEVLLVRV